MEELATAPATDKELLALLHKQARLLAEHTQTIAELRTANSWLHDAVARIDKPAPPRSTIFTRARDRFLVWRLSRDRWARATRSTPRPDAARRELLALRP